MPGASWCGNPISIGNGNKYEHLEDYRTQGANPLVFERFYNSLGNTGSLASTLGTKWRSNYDRHLRIASATSVTAERADGQEVNFSLIGGKWICDSDIDLTLTQKGILWTLTDSNDTTESYTTIGTTKAILQSIKTRNGYKQTLLHNNTDQTLASVSDSYGRSLIFAYQSGLVKTVTTPENTLTFGYTAQGSQSLLTSVSYSTTPATAVTYIYDNPSLPTFLTKLMDEDGNLFAQWTYDSQGRATSSQHAGGVELTSVTYNDTDNSRTVTNALGVTDTYSFSIMQGVPKVTRISRAATPTTDAAVQVFSYDQNGYLSGKTDWNNNTTVYTNDAHGQPLTITEGFASPVERTTTITYDQTWVHLPSTVVTPGVTTTFKYDGSGNLQNKTLTDTSAMAVPYPTAGTARTWIYGWTNYLLTSITGPRTDVSAVTKLGYDSTGALTSITNALSQPTKITNTPGGRPLTITDPNGTITQLTYDGRQRLKSKAVTTAAGVLTTSLVYDLAGNLSSTTQPDGSTLTNTYDPAHRLTSVTDSLGNYVSYTLDALDDRTQINIYKADGTHTWQRKGTFDALGRLHIATAGAGQTTTRNYDPNGNLTSVIDGRGYTTTNTYDALNRPGTSTDANAGITKTGFDAHDRVVSVTDANGNSTYYTRNGFGDVIQRVSPDSGTAIFYVDNDGNVTSKKDALGIVTNQTFDPLDRPLKRTYPASPAENVSFTYDEASGLFGIGWLTSVMDQAGTLTRRYDELGNLTLEQRVNGANTLTTGYGYDKASRIAAITYPDGTLVSYQHDAAGYLSNASAKLPDATAATQLATFTHQPFGPLGTVKYGNGVTEAWTFDQSYRPQTLVDAFSGTNLQNLAYIYDLADNPTTITDAVNAANSQTLGYDPLGRLYSAVSGPGGYGTFGWQYDPVGNRRSQNFNGVTTTYTYAPGTNRLATISPIPGLSASNGLQAPADHGVLPVQTLFAGMLPSMESPKMATGPPVEPVMKTVASVHAAPRRSPESRQTPTLLQAAYRPGASSAAASLYNAAATDACYNQAARSFPLHISGQLITPVPSDGSTPQFSVTIAESHGGTYTVYYTLDGSTPTTSSPIYTAPIIVPANTTIKVCAYSPQTDIQLSESGSATFPYFVTPTPTLSPAGGVFTRFQFVGAFDTQPRTTFYYTLDGTTPTTRSARLVGSIMLTSTATLKVIGVSSTAGYQPSAVATASYTNSSQSVATVTTDLNGNITGIPPANSTASMTVSYNAAGRPKQFTGSPTAASLLYDAFGQRIVKADSGTPPTLYSFGPGGLIIAENSSGFITDYIYADGRPIAQIQPGSTPAANQVSYVLADRLGTPNDLVNSNGVTVWSTTYQPFGTTGTINASTNQSLRLPGQLTDAETGFSYNLNRDYMPNLGRYLESDPIGLRGGINTYGYVGARPLSLRDQTGLASNDSVLDRIHDSIPSQDDINGTIFALMQSGNPADMYAGEALFIGDGALLGAEDLAGEIGSLLGGRGAAAGAECPLSVARVIPGTGPFSTLGRSGNIDVFVTTPEAIQGLDSAGIAQRLTIPYSDTYTVLEFPTPNQLASPVFRPDPGFVGGGFTLGGAPEFVIPNGPIPPGATTRIVGPLQ